MISTIKGFFKSVIVLSEYVLEDSEGLVDQGRLIQKTADTTELLHSSPNGSLPKVW